MKSSRVLFLSDLDGTWLSRNPENRKRLDDGVQQLRDEYRPRGIELEFGYVTARPPVRVAREHLPTPNWTITYNGGCIHRGEPGHYDANGAYQVEPQLPEWDRLNQTSRFEAEHVIDDMRELLAQPDYRNLEMKTVGQVVQNPAADACPYIAHFCFDQNSVRLEPDERADHNGNSIPDLFEKESFHAPDQIQRVVHDLDVRLAEEGIQHKMSPVYPFLGQPVVMFDAGSPQANKGDAVEFLMSYRDVAPDHTIIAGDGGNDIAMMRRSADGGDDGRRAILVGGEKSLYEAAQDLQHAIARPGGEDCSLGVLAGLRQHLEDIAREVRPGR